MENSVMLNAVCNEPVSLKVLEEPFYRKGFSPFVNKETGTWWEYDDDKKGFFDTGIIAQGRDGNDYVITEQDYNTIVERTLRNIKPTLEDMINVVKDDLTDLNDKTDYIMPIRKSIGVNKFNINAKVTGSLNQNNGDVDDGASTVSEFIDLTGNRGYVTAYMCEDSGSPQYSFSKYVFYDSSRRYIIGYYDSTGYNKLDNSRIPIPENAKYVRFEFWNRNKIMVVFDNEGDWKNNWVAYSETNRKNVNQLEDDVNNHEKRIESLEDSKVSSVNGRTGIVTGLAEQSEVDALANKTINIMPITVTIGKNKFNIEKKVFGELNVDDGSFTDGAYTCTPFIDLTGNTGYVTAYQCLDSKSPEYAYWKCCFYDSNKSFISGSWDSTGRIPLSNSTVEVPSNAKYVRFQFMSGSSRQYFMVTFDDSTVHKANYIDYEETNRKNVNQIEDKVDNHETRIKSLESTSGNKWEGKNVLVLGDSISDKRYHHVEIPAWDKWPQVLSNKLGFSLTNDSLHASGFLVNLGGKEIGERSLINRIENHNGEIYDMVILFMGINDAIQSMTIGTAPTDDKTADFYSAVDYCFNYIKNNFTSARFLVLLPLEAKPNWYASNQQAYVNVLKEECEKYNIPYLDLYKQSGFDAKNDNFRNMFTELGGSNGNYAPDGLHPNKLWDNNYLAPQIEAFIDRFI